MEIISINTKRGRSMVNNYKASLDYYGRRDLSNCYGRFSTAKQSAFDYCKNLEKSLNGFDGTVISFNCRQFTYGFQFVDSVTGEICSAYITKLHDYVIK